MRYNICVLFEAAKFGMIFFKSIYYNRRGGRQREECQNLGDNKARGAILGGGKEGAGREGSVEMRTI